jgi:lysine 2,3-aminomutase
VNDNPETLANLFNNLLMNNITPYYLHHPDLAKGTGHFYLNLDNGKNIFLETAKLVSGLALPKYVIDIPGGFGKIPVDSQQVIKHSDGYILIDNKGIRHNYPIL